MIKRYFAAKDNTISNAFEPNLTTRAVSASMGQSDILEVFSIYGQVSSSSGFSTEEARVLIEFDLSDIQADIASGIIPSNAKYYLRLFNAEHGSTLPREFDIEVHSVSSAWQEGLGLDMESYKDLSSGLGSNWTVRSGSTAWSSPGGDVHANTSSVQSFPIGTEDLNVDVTTQVSAWLNTSRSNEGFLVKLPTALTGQQRSYYTKKFFARGTEFFHKRPCLEVRWDSTIQDDRINFYASSSLAPAADNINTLYLYNYHRGQLANIPDVGTGKLYVDLYETLGGTALTQCVDTPATGGWVETGIYTASVCVSTTASTIHDVWRSANASTVLTFGPGIPSDGTLAITFGALGTFTLTFNSAAGSSDAEIGSDKAATIDPSAEGDAAANAQKVMALLKNGVTGDGIKNAYNFAYDGSSVGAETVTITAKERGSTHNITVTESLSNISSAVTDGSDSNYHTGSIDVKSATALSSAPDNHLVVSVSNNRSFHYTEQTSRFYFYIRQKKWSPAIYTTATTTPTTEVFENLHFKIIKVVTDETIFDYDTTNNSTLLSYDSRGNYFDLDIGMLEPNYTYQIELALYNVATKTYEQLSFKHKFRVVNNEY